MPTDERIRLHVHQRIAPREHSAQSGHYPPGGIVRASWSDLPFLKERQLFAKEEILRGQGAVGTGREENKPTQVEQDHDCGEETMLDSSHDE
jgi:cytochrome b